jgi:hypothetical protein
MVNKEKLHKTPKWVVYLIFTVLSLAVLFVLRVIRPHDLQTTYSLMFQDIYKKSPVLEIAAFQQSERWVGNYTFDSERSIDENVGMSIFSMNSSPTKITLKKNIDLSPYNDVHLYVYMDSRDSLDGIKSLRLLFSDSKEKEAYYEISPLKTGWNYIRIKLSDFVSENADRSAVRSVSLELTSKKNRTAQVSFDRLWAQHEVRKEDFVSFDPSYVNLKTVFKKTYLHVSSPRETKVVFPKSLNTSSFSYTVGLSPLKFGALGISFLTDSRVENGYIFAVNGKTMDRWRILRRTDGKDTVLKSGALAPNTFEKGAMIWLRAEKKGNAISVSYTVNGQQYIPLTDISDRGFSKGYIGVLASGAYLIDSVDVKE